MSRKSFAFGGGIVSMAVSLAIGSTAAAGVVSDYSPVGIWEGSVSGRVGGEKIVGLAEVEFVDEGDQLMVGVAMARLVEDVIDLEGSWDFDPDNDRKIVGLVEVGGVVMELTGRARTDRWIHVKADGEDGNRLRMHGKPFDAADLPDPAAFYETYEGSLKVGGERGEVAFAFSDPGKGAASLFDASAETIVDEGAPSDWAGVGIVNHRRRFIISMNLLDDVGDPTTTFVSVWGRWRDSRRFSAHGKILVPADGGGYDTVNVRASRLEEAPPAP